MVRFGINEVQANAVLDMRLRTLRRLEEEAIRTERTGLSEEQSDLQALVGDEKLQWQVVHSQIKDVRAHFAKSDERRTALDSAPEVDVISLKLIERSHYSYLFGKGLDTGDERPSGFAGEFKFKEGWPLFALHAETTDKLLVFAQNSRFIPFPVTDCRGQGLWRPFPSDGGCTCG